MAINQLDRYQKPDAVLVQELEGEAVLLNLANELYFGLDEVGYRMYSLVTTCESLGAAYQVLRQEYDVEPEQLERDFQKLVEELIASGLIVKATA